jgi:SAM-dependent methyltransferase
MATGDEPGWARALGRIDTLQRGTELLAVLRGAATSGMLRALASPVDSGELATGLGLPVARVQAAIEVLVTHDVVVGAGTSWVLADDWRDLATGAAPYDVSSLLGLVRIREEQLAGALVDAVDYWEMGEADRLTVARGVSLNPASDLAVASARRGLDAMEGVAATLDAGGAVLELGCGVGSRLTALMRAFPRATAVGVELAADLVDYGRRTAETLGVADRLIYVAADAGAYEPEQEFDLTVWSQFFFPQSARKGALATARKALRPGGWITMPVIWTGDDPTNGPEAQELAAEKLLLDVWHVPPLTTAQVRLEVEAAGFIDVRVDADPLVHYVRGRQPG